MATWEKVGVVGVDAGLIWLGDPCYIIHSTDENPDLGKDWGEFCSRLYPNDGNQHDDGVRQWMIGEGHAGLGVTVGSGHGDGVYDVQVQRDQWGRVMRVMIDFDEEPEEEEDWCEECGEPYEYCECGDRIDEEEFEENDE